MARSASTTSKPTSSEPAGRQERRSGIVAIISSFVRLPPAIVLLALAAMWPAVSGAQGLGVESASSSYRAQTERDLAATASEPTRIGGDEVLLAGAVDPTTYRVGPGDEFRLLVPGLFDAGTPLIVDAEGGIMLPGSSGRVVVGGLTLEQARNEVGNALARVVRKRDFALSLVRPRRFKVYVTGAVRDPGAQEASPATRVSEVIDRAGGILPEGSRRLIQIQRPGGETLTADLAAFSGLGTLAANPFLDGGDVIRVGYRGAEVGVFGGVAVPGIYELAAGETVRSLVALGGGLVPGAQPGRARLSHLEAGQRQEEPLDLTALAAGIGSEPGNTILDRPLSASDVLVIPLDQEQTRIHHVLVEGEVMFPGRYPIRSGVDTAAEVLAQAGGFTTEANVAAARISRARAAAELEVENPAATAQEPASPEMPATSDAGRLGEAEAEESASPPLRFGDLPRATRELELASRSQAGDEVRASWTSVPLADSVRLRDGDRLYVPKLEGRVRVDGRVRAPGLVPFEPGRELDEYVQLAGGFDKKADKRRVYLQRAGRPGFEAASGAGPIQDGDAIWVPESEPRGVLGSAREFVIFLAQVATIAIVVDQLVN